MPAAKRCQTRALLWASRLAALLGLASCGGDDDPVDPLAPYRNQVLHWQACDPTALGDYAEQAHALGDRVACADLRAPLDYAAPDKGEIKVALLRVAAEDGAPRQGAILMNPGGPGIDGLPMPLIIGQRWNLPRQSSPADQLFQSIAQRYDLIGFSPRGVGSSTRLDCATGVEQRFIVNPARDRSPTNTDNMLYNARQIAESCRDNPMTPHIQSDAIARDMDLVRHLLGDEQLNFFGISAGSWLGNWYAGLFPGRVGRMVLWAVLDFTKILNDQDLVQETAKQRILDQVLIPYATRFPERFELGTDPQAIRQMLDDLPLELHAATVSALNQNLSRSSADSAVQTLRATQVVSNLLAGAPGMDEVALLAWVETSPALNALTRPLAISLVKEFFRQKAGADTPLDVIGREATTWAIFCNDTGTDFSPEHWVELSNQNVALAPDFGGDRNLKPCLYWGGPSVHKPAQQVAGLAPGMVLVQAELDPLTPLAGARNSLSSLPNASLIEISDEYTHFLFPPYGVECVDRPVAEYFLTGQQPPRETRCQGLPLAADAEANPISTPSIQ